MTRLPAFALGGIDADNLPHVRAAGVNRIAVSAAIATADDPQAADWAKTPANVIDALKVAAANRTPSKPNPSSTPHVQSFHLFLRIRR